MRTSYHLYKISIVFIIAAVLLAIPAQAKPSKTRKKKASPKAAVTAPRQDEAFLSFIADLKSENPEKIVVAIQMLGATGNPDACQHIIELLQTGPGNDITNIALQTLGVLGNPAAVDTIIAYLSHRRSDARLNAIFALEGFTTPKIKDTLESKLRDSDAQVRAAAALLLGTRGDASSVPILFKAFDRGVNESAIAIGQLGSSADALKLTEYLGKLDISVLLPGFKEFLLGTHLDGGMKLQILNILFDFAGPEVRQFAIQMRTKMKTVNPDIEYDDPILKMLSKMISQIVPE